MNSFDKNINMMHYLLTALANLTLNNICFSHFISNLFKPAITDLFWPLALNNIDIFSL